MAHDGGYRLLLVEDNGGDALFVRELLAGMEDYRLTFDVVPNLKQAVSALEADEFDGIILDLTLPDSRGIETLEQIRATAPAVPVIIFTGMDTEEELRAETARLGVFEFIGKNEAPPHVLSRSVYWMIRHKRAEAGHHQFERLVGSIPDAVIVTNRSGVILFVNNAAYELFDKGPEHFVGELIGFAVKEGAVSEIEVYRGGDRRTCEMRVVDCEWNEAPAYLALIRDITLQKRLGEQLQQSQKMEAVGLMAGGVAHDFNNLLLVMLVYAELLSDEYDESDPRLADIHEILQSIDRAQALTRQLLAFSRKQPADFAVLNPNEVVDGVYKMLRHTLPANIEIAIVPNEESWSIMADRGQLEQVLMNLAVNARDAMPNGGRFAIEVENQTIHRLGKGVPAGDYVALRVSDTGSGIVPEHLERIFDPFFTTKERGRGTGLGLSTCYGIIAQAGGSLTVESELGVGSTFLILLPRTELSIHHSIAGKPEEAQAAGAETILVVEDDHAVLRATAAALTRGGYSILTASNGDEARRLVQGHRQEIDLILSDIVMPQLSGTELSKYLEIACPEMPVIFMTGYSDDPVVADSGDHRIANHRAIMKPFRPNELLKIVREVLDNKAMPRSSSGN